MYFPSSVLGVVTSVAVVTDQGPGLSLSPRFHAQPMLDFLGLDPSIGMGQSQSLGPTHH